MKNFISSKQIPSGSILGLSYSGMHDSAIAIVAPDGTPVYAMSLERASRVKQDGRPPYSLLDQVPWDKIEKIAISVEEEYVQPDDGQSSFHPLALSSVERQDRSHSYEFFDKINKLPKEKVYIPHHLSHAASAFWLSDYEDSLCLVYDGGISNEEWFGGVYFASRQDGIQIVDRFSAHQYANVAHLYTSVTTLLGFTPLKHEGKITGLAAYGEPSEDCRAIFEEWLKNPAQLYPLIHWQNTYSDDTPPSLATSALAVEEIRSCLAPFTKEQIAATVQKVAEDHMLEIVANIQKNADVSSENMCLSGGVFANVKINQRISDAGYKSTFVSPPMSDDGTALGAALQVASKLDTFIPSPVKDMYLGTGFSAQEVQNLLNEKELQYTTPSNMPEHVADLMSRGYVVAVYQGRTEFGPRALGNRSIIASSHDPEINKSLNDKLNRTEFMPFAPMCLAEDAKELFRDVDKVSHAAEFMTVTLDCSDEMAKKCPAVVHCDQTARPQTVTPESNPFIYEVLKNYKRITGSPAIVNTSFNVHEEPIVCTPEDAIRGFFESSLDYLYIEGFLIELNANPKAQLVYLKNKINGCQETITRQKGELREQSITLGRHARNAHLHAEKIAATNSQLVTEVEQLNSDLQEALDKDSEQQSEIQKSQKQISHLTSELDAKTNQLEQISRSKVWQLRNIIVRLIRAQ